MVYYQGSIGIFSSQTAVKTNKQKNSRRLRSSTDTGDALTKTECVSVPPTLNNDDTSWRQNLCNQKAEWWDQQWPTDPPTYQEQSLAGIIIGGRNEYLKPKRKNQQSCGLVSWWGHTSPQHWLCLIHLLSLNRWENHVVTDGRPFFLYSWWGLRCHRSPPRAACQHNYSNEVFRSASPAEDAVWNQLVMYFVVVERPCQRVAVFCEVLNIAVEWPDCMCRW